MQIVNQAIEEYMLQLAGPSGAVLGRMEALAREKKFPIVGPLVGRVLFQLALLQGARRILELGSGFGYSAWWFAQALGEEDELILTEFSAENLQRARGFLGEAGLRPRIRFLEGDALELAGQLEGEFDIVFNDVDKHLYPQVVKQVAARLPSGGLLITDNALWSGMVVDPSADDRDTAGILEYNRLIFEDPLFFSSILPIRDGVAVSLKV
ncbi:MAG: O-methyltransferase [Acidobacteriota bacterium]